MKLKRSSCWQEGTESQYENRVVRQVDLFMVINPTLGYSHTVSSEAKPIAVMANSRLISIGCTSHSAKSIFETLIFVTCKH